MNLLSTIKNWFGGPEKNKLEHFDMVRIEGIIDSIKSQPLLKFMQPQIEQLLYDIALSAKDKKEAERKFIIINGVSGSGKTNFVYEYLKDYLLSVGAIKKNQGEHITKIAKHNLSENELRKITAEELIARKEQDCIDGILIIDEVTARNRNTHLVVDLINRIYSDEKYKFTSVVLMGTTQENLSIIKTFNLEHMFPHSFRLSFFTPGFNQIAEIFEEYVKREGDYILTEKAKATLVFYFSKIKPIKTTKRELNFRGVLKFPLHEQNYSYTSEMFPIYNDILATKSIDDKEIDQQDVIQSDHYQKMLDDLDKLESYFTNH